MNTFFHVRPPCSVYSLLFSIGQSESFEEQLRSVLAQYHYAHIVKTFEAKGVMFTMYMYVPEKHPETNEVFYEREDEAHLIKVHSLVINNCIAVTYFNVHLAYCKPHKKWGTR